MPHRPDRKREYKREYMQRKRANVTPAVNTLAVASSYTQAVRMKRKGLRVVRRGTVLEGELPKELQRQGPKWLKARPKVRLIRGRSKEKPDG